MPSDAIVTENLTKVYGKLTAVDHVNVKVASGTVFGLLGPNGAGKTTMIKLLPGLTDMTEGDAWVAGYDVRRDPMHVKQRIGWVASEVILDDDFTAWENLWLQAKLQSLPEWKERAGDLLTYFGLNDRRKDRVKTFSTGMRKKLEIALALLHQPEVVFMDEPTIGLDANTRRMLWDLISGVNKEFGITVLLTSHYIEEADALCQQISIIDHGKIVASGSPSALKARVESDFVELETGEAVDEAKLRAIPGVTSVRSQGKTWVLQVSAADEVLRTFRNPWVLVITFVQPFMWLAFFGSSFSGASPALVQQIFHTSSYIAFLLPGVLATSMLTVGMFGSMSTIQDKRFGFMKRILLTPTTKATVYLSKVLGSTTRGLVQIPVMIAAAAVFGVVFNTADWSYLGYLAIFATGMLLAGTAVASRYLKAE